MQAALASLRCALLALYACLFFRFDVAVVDIVSLPLLVFSLFRYKSLFYCHYPDKLLAQSLAPRSPQSLLKRIYRTFVDALEAFSLRHATRVACNSRFTSKAFVDTFPNLPEPRIIYPCVFLPNAVAERKPSNLLLSLNRYERKKNVLLAVQTLAFLRAQHNADVRLVVAGGYDNRLAENVNYFEEITKFVNLHKLQDRVTMLKNISDERRRSLFREALVVLYTPANEHFGIVPLEAMGVGVPIIAVKSGGPLETVEHRKSGFLCEDSAEDFGQAVLQLVSDPQKSLQMGVEGRRRVEHYFSREVLGTALQNLLMDIREE